MLTDTFSILIEKYFIFHHEVFNTILAVGIGVDILYQVEGIFLYF